MRKQTSRTIARRNAERAREISVSGQIFRPDEAAKDEKFASDEFFVCATCKGHKYLWVHSEAFPDDPPIRMTCGSCMSLGVTCIDNRSMNSYE